MEFAISNLVDRCFRASTQNPRQKSHTFFPALYRSLQNPINIFLGTQRNQTHFLYILIEPNPSLQNRNRSIPSSLLSGFTNSIEPFLSFNRQIYIRNLQIQTWKGLLLQMGSRTATKDIITLRGSAAIVSEFFGMFWINIVRFLWWVLWIFEKSWLISAFSLFKTLILRLFCQQVSEILTFLITSSSWGCVWISWIWISAWIFRICFLQEIRNFPRQIQVVFALLFCRLL